MHATQVRAVRAVDGQRLPQLGEDVAEPPRLDDRGLWW